MSYVWLGGIRTLFSGILATAHRPGSGMRVLDMRPPGGIACRVACADVQRGTRKGEVGLAA